MNLYADIIGVNQATFFPLTSTHGPVLIAFIARLNLDLFIENASGNMYNTLTEFMQAHVTSREKVFLNT